MRPGFDRVLAVWPDCGRDNPPRDVSCAMDTLRTQTKLHLARWGTSLPEVSTSRESKVSWRRRRRTETEKKPDQPEGETHTFPAVIFIIALILALHWHTDSPHKRGRICAGRNPATHPPGGCGSVLRACLRWQYCFTWLCTARRPGWPDFALGGPSQIRAHPVASTATVGRSGA